MPTAFSLLPPNASSVATEMYLLYLFITAVTFVVGKQWMWNVQHPALRDFSIPAFRVKMERARPVSEAGTGVGSRARRAPLPFPWLTSRTTWRR